MDWSFFQCFSNAESLMTFKGLSEGTHGFASIRNIVSFDIETFSPDGFPYNAEDPIVNYSLVVPLSKFGLFAISAIGSPEDEAILLRLLNKLIEAFNGFYLLTYNGSKFDLEYVVKRGHFYGLNFEEAFNMQRHIDVYKLVKWLGVKSPCYSQKSIEKALGIKRVVVDISGQNYHSAYKNFINDGDLTPLFYNLEDSFGCLKIARRISRIFTDNK
jgi:uncharacterized protein YprB with RNaseH-like and TPR domain